MPQRREHKKDVSSSYLQPLWSVYRSCFIAPLWENFTIIQDLLPRLCLIYSRYMRP